MKLAVFFVGELNDGGFNSSALAGVEAARGRGDAEILIVNDVPYQQDDIKQRLSQVAEEVDGVVFIGGQGDVAMPAIATEHPDKRFAVIQGQRLGKNLAAYDVRQEDSAFLAGCLAARLSKTGTVAHLSGHRVRPGLKGRAAFVGGVHHVDPAMTVLTGFCGTQDDNEVTRIWADAQFASGADILFTMLNGARQGAIDACRAYGVRQIGNALDWCVRDPEVFVGSALARIDLGVETAIADMIDDRTPDDVVEFGIGEGNFVRLSMDSSVAEPVQREIQTIAGQIKAGLLPVPTDYDGAEFTVPEASCSKHA